jgi:hypothetical protein
MDKPIRWEAKALLKPVDPVRWECSACGALVSSESAVGGVRESFGSRSQPHVLVFCPGCGFPTHLINPGTTSEAQIPAPSYGRPVRGVTDKSVERVFDEARACCSLGAYTAAVLACRKLLMHVAVALGAKEGESFASYVSFLKEEQHVTPASHSWVDAIREVGNEQNHEISLADESTAQDMIDFCSMLLQTVYEYPERARSHLARRKPGTDSP